MFPKGSKRNLLVKGHQERSFNRVYDIPQKKNWLLCRDERRLFKANEVTEIDEDVTGCLSALKVRPQTRSSVTADLKLPKMTVIYILGTGNTMRTNITGRDYVHR